jgi:hypothetical protein
MLPAPPCPRCGSPGRRVPQTTVAHLVRDAAVAAAIRGEPKFCGASECDVVYFDEVGGTVSKHELRVLVFCKETSPSRPVCYCFGYSVADVLNANEGEEDENRIVTAIKAACGQGLDRCEETNPEGRCCLGNVRRTAKTEAEACSSGCGGSCR